MSYSSNDFNFLDCTLRDGGYYTNWDFDADFVARYLEAMNTAGVDYVELGLRSTPKSKYLGPFAYCSDQFLETLNLSEEVKYGVMLNASDFVDRRDCYNQDAFNKLFTHRSESKISIVRIATDFKDVKNSMALAKDLDALGYDVGLNLMKIGLRTEDEIQQVLSIISGSEVLPQVLYFADSLGNMKTAEVESTFRLLSSSWQKPIGIHAHNNMGQAIENSIFSANLGVSWIDGTVTGMGRGAGNAATEILLQELLPFSSKRYHPEEVFKIVLEDFQPLQKQYGWGFNLLYYLSARKGIHPTFVQNMLSEGQYDANQMMAAIDNLGRSSAQSFSEKKLTEAITETGDGVNVGSFSASEKFRGRDVVLLANGEQLGKHRRAVQHYIEKRKPVVISLNVNHFLGDESIDYYAVCNKARMMADLDKIRSLSRPIFMPRGKIGKFSDSVALTAEILDYGMRIGGSDLVAGSNHCEVPGDLVALYSISLAVAAGANRILFAGFDGFSGNSKQQLEMDLALKNLRERQPEVQLVAITKTTYSNLDHNSVYNPEV